MGVLLLDLGQEQHALWQARICDQRQLNTYHFDYVCSEMKSKQIELRSASADEAPQCYKSLLDVLDYQGVNETIEICHYLRPIR